eukprot:TRINITY_DN5621_c0_g2_i1.p1 TRINITY_DN5621_c0_g2~~TRINITY_DN5621_c0_g2_i1.p1  ORF type:complete len:263 (+),score=86.02 TRINITY_DN5621_c0_g2_i1:70-789(+)
MKVYDTIEGRALKLIQNSKMFFVSSAPHRGEHINVSPKGLDNTLKVTGPLQVMYLESWGSGCETLAHLRENGRICLLFCAFSGDPLIVRLHGRGVAHLAGTPSFSKLAAAHFSDVSPLQPELCRSIIQIDVFRVSDSCGYGVPRMTYTEQRDTLPEYLEKKPIGSLERDEELTAKWLVRGVSLDGLPGAGISLAVPGAVWRSASVWSVARDWLAENYQGVAVGAIAASCAITLSRNRAQ